MGKKRILDRRAQITIFMILGLIILLIFVFMIQLTSKTIKGELVGEKEKIFTKAFQKEAMRIFIEDCLSDALEEGLVTIGKQGRLWSDQPGGKKKFSENINGIEDPFEAGTKISYAITREEYPEDESAYPCKNLTNSSPEFCQYKFPNTLDGFGDLDLKPNTIESDLKGYLINQTLWCIYNYTQTNISNKAQIEINDYSLNLEFENDGINVNAEFPLKFSLGDEEFYHLSQFDFFYPSQIKWLLESAVSRPLFYDWKYIDFNYSEGILKQPKFKHGSLSTGCEIFKNYFLCEKPLFYDKYAELGVVTEKFSTISGDDIFKFTSNKIINRPESYEFKFARQNRPPALDYVSRSQCIDNNYDYLVVINDLPEQFYLGGKSIPITFDYNSNEQIITEIISNNPDFIIPNYIFPLIIPPGETKTMGMEFKPSKAGKQFVEIIIVSNQGNLSSFSEGEGYLPEEDVNQSCLNFDDKFHGDVKISLCAMDPDEDKINYGFVNPSWSSSYSNFFPWLYLENGFFTQGRHNITAVAEDEHGLQDKQIVRILVDRPLTLNVSLDLPYPNITSKQGGVYFVSTEDPAFLNVTFPLESDVVPADKRKIVLNYTNNKGNESFQYQLGTTWFPTNNACYSFPGSKGCNIDDYKNGDELKNWKQNLISSSFNNFREATEDGWLNLSFGVNYCNNVDKENSVGVSVVVKSCVPYQNPEHPFAFNSVGKYHEYTFGVDSNGNTNYSNQKTNQQINPLLATHSCCDGDVNVPRTWKLKDEGDVCFTNPVPGCYGGITETTALPGFGTYILEVQHDTCDGVRGNVCGKEKISTYYSPNLFSSGVLICGNNSLPGCNNIASTCQGQPAWSYVNLDSDPLPEIWCGGKMGCSKDQCDKDVVSESLVNNYGNYRYQKIISNLVNDENEFGMHCGCKADDNGNPCDGDIDSVFEGACQDGICVAGGQVTAEEQII
jgi:hypothetical protein